jgi:lactate permease
MMFSLFQFGVAENLGTSAPLILALQTVGASAGNVICVSNVVAAAATVGLLGREGVLMRQLLPVVVYYLAMAGVLGMGWLALGGGKGGIQGSKFKVQGWLDVCLLTESGVLG